MNKFITHKITLSIFFVIACQFTAKAQDSAKKVIVVVRPGGITPTPATKTAAVNNTVPASTGSNSSKYATAPGTQGTTPASTGAQKTAAVVPAAAAVKPAQKAAVTPYIAPGSRSNTYMAPSTAERTSSASYMHKSTVPATTTAAPATGTAVATSGNSSKYATVAPAAPGKATPAVAPPAPGKKDTVVITKIEKDTVPPEKHKGNKIVFAEIGGPGLAISINYDMRFKKDSKDGFGFRAGVGYFAAGNNTVFTVPLMVNYLYGKDGKYIEIGLGTTFLNSKGDNYSSSVWEFDDVTGFIATAVIGVRYEPNKALNFRLGYVPILYDEGLINAGGFSIGYTF